MQLKRQLVKSYRSTLYSLDSKPESSMPSRNFAVTRLKPTRKVSAAAVGAGLFQVAAWILSRYYGLHLSPEYQVVGSGATSFVAGWVVKEAKTLGGDGHHGRHDAEVPGSGLPLEVTAQVSSNGGAAGTPNRGSSSIVR